MTNSTPLLNIRKLSKIYGSGPARVIAVNDFSLDIYKGMSIGLAGESGCGKSTLGKMIARLITPTQGEIYFKGRNILKLSKADGRSLCRQLQIVLQDPYGSLNPRLNVEAIISEGLNIHKIPPGNRVRKVLEDVGLSENFLTRFPHELSGGQRQRINLARSLVLEPEFLIFDESVSALDVSHQKQILELLKDLGAKYQFTYLFISHDLSILKAACQEIVVMYRGRVVEQGASEEILSKAKHPYTQALVSAIPLPDPIQERSRRRLVLAGDPPGPFEIIPGCQFHPRCPHAQELCRDITPQLTKDLACHFPLA